MRSLRVVGITEDGSVVLEDPARRERFTVPADEQLRAAARGDLTRLGQIAIELESQLRPREIQARIRAGASVEQVASAAGVPVQKIERFAYPVLLERTRTAELARAAHPVRDDGPDVRTLAETVAHTFGLRGQDHTGADWDSWKGEDGRWVVALGWRSGRSDIRAHWVFQPGAHGGTVTALDDHARDLVEGRPQQPLRPVGPVIDMARPDDAAVEVAEEVVPAAVNGAVNGEARRIAPEQRRGSLPGSRREPVRGVTRSEVRSELAGPPTHPAARSTDTLTTDTRTTDVGRVAVSGAGAPTDADRTHDAGPVPTPAPGAPSVEVETADAETGDAAADVARDEAPSVAETSAGPDGKGPDAAEAEAEAGPAPDAEAVPAPEVQDEANPAVGAENAHTENADTENADTEKVGADTVASTDEPETGAEKAGAEKTGAEKTGAAKAGDQQAAATDGAKTGPAVATASDPAAGKAPEKTAGTPTEKTAEKTAGTNSDKTSGKTSPEAEGAAAPAGGARPAGRAEGEQPAPAKRTKKGKPVMPSWDEVLLGVRGR
ncbi:septation protein SepH [Pseudonocardia kujensis]|uniref:septation protein SepH n=1 Tax=Pseudonocardia kujensis TaxID=1128675 RepID=UPI0022B7FB91|nr:septation protein SepH [Pseudonocardia kujensis]